MNMRTLEDYQKVGKSIYDRLHLQTYPIGITFIRALSEIPQGSLRPKDLGQQASLCQSFTYARRFGFTMAMTGDDNFCTAATSWFKWEEATPDEIIHSQMLNLWHKDLEAETARWELYTRRWGKDYPEKIKGHIGFIVSPLHDVKLVPDTVMIYGNSLNMAHMIHAMVYDGKNYPSSDFDCFGESCQKGTLVPYLTGVPQIIVPGFGDHTVAATHPDEIAMGMPAELVFKIDENLFLTGQHANLGQPVHTVMAMSLNESATPGWPYLRQCFNEHKKNKA
jgi:uncharacterized protein (DUF169 family)